MPYAALATSDQAEWTPYIIGASVIWLFMSYGFAAKTADPSGYGIAFFIVIIVGSIFYLRSCVGS